MSTDHRLTPLNRIRALFVRPAHPVPGRPSRQLGRSWHRSSGYPVPIEQLLSVERGLLRLNRWMFGYDRPEPDGRPGRPVPGAIKLRTLTTLSILDALGEMVAASRPRIGGWEIPWQSPAVEQTVDLDPEHPVWISFEDGRTVVRIHPAVLTHPEGIGAALAHGLAHFVLEHNAASMTVPDADEQERMIDLLVFALGYGRLYLHRTWSAETAGAHFFTRQPELAVSAMAYAHARCGYQHDLPVEAILEGLHPDAHEITVKCLTFLTGNADERFEVLVCPHWHVLRGDQSASGALIQCRCGWRHEYWRTRSERIAAFPEEAAAHAGQLAASLHGGALPH
jgi:hypothetical protein